MPPRNVSIPALGDWLRSRPVAADGLLALVLLSIGIPQLFLEPVPAPLREPDAVNVALVVLTTSVLALRRRAPMPMLIFLICGELALTFLDYPTSVADVGAFLIAIYTVAAHRALAHSALGGVLAYAAFCVMTWVYPVGMTFLAFVTNSALLAGVWALGRNLRLRRAHLAELEHRAARLERARGTDARAARVEERSRIARELHDVVAHHVSVMTVQAGAARRIAARDPERAREAMATIEEVGRTTLNEMRRIVGVLRTDAERESVADGGGLSPQPGVGELAELVGKVRDTGLAVELEVSGTRRPLSPGVDLAAYRLVQEALTNVLKHAGPQARAWVRLEYEAGALTVQVEDDGRGAASALADREEGSGHGLLGMHERVALYRGELAIGPRVGGGFAVRARFPLET